MPPEDLARLLGGLATPVPRHAVSRRLSVALGIGAIGTLIMILGRLGLRADLGSAMLGFPFWMKWGYTIALATVAIIATARLARPEVRLPRMLWLLAIPVAMLAMLTLAELVRTPAGDWSVLWMGQSWRVCTLRVVTLSIPLFAALIVAFRRFAPTRLRLTGTVAGLAAGAFGATLYGLHCPEASALFILTWYSLGIAVAAAVGALTGPKLLCW